MSERFPPRPDLDPAVPVVAPGGATAYAGPIGTAPATWRWYEVLLVAFLGFVLGSVAASPVYAVLGDTTKNGASGISELLQGLVADVAMVGLVAFWLHRWHPTWRAAMVPLPKDHALREMAMGAGLGIAVRIGAGVASGIVVALLSAVSGESVILPEQVRTDFSAPQIVAFALFAVVVAPITEELVFRGLLFRSIRERQPFWVAALLSAVPFGLIHFTLGQPWQDTLSLQLTMVVTGFGLAWIYERRGTLLANICGHAAFNTIAVVVVVYDLLAAK